MSRATFVLIGALALTLGAGSPVIAEDDRQDVFDACVADGSAREDCCRASGGRFFSASKNCVFVDLSPQDEAVKKKVTPAVPKAPQNQARPNN